ncbi:MAG TPA: PAS domain S-box protein [Spirochaetota bacterium]|nr:PAS domain S-box protein [Spirochaetota bacterium]
MEKAEKQEKQIVADDFYHEIFNGVNDMILVHDPETGAILDANSKCLEIGYTADEIRRMGVAGFSPKGEEYSPDRIMLLIRKAAEGCPQLFEWGFYDRAGKLHPTEVSLKRATIRGRNVVLAILRDISERKAVRQETRQAKDNFHNIVEKYTDGLIVLDYEWRVHFANPVAVHFFTHDKNVLAGGRFDHTMKNKKSAEVVITRLNGKPGTGEMRKTNTEWEGKPAYLISIRDVTGPKKLVEELTRAIGSIRTLRGLLPICSHCKKIRNDKGYWEQIETYISLHSEAEFSHGLCPDCVAKYYPQIKDRHET